MNTKQSYVKFLVWLIAGFVLIILICFFRSTSSNKSTGFINTTNITKDNASNDTPVETLKTLTVQVANLEDQNKTIVDQNKALQEQNTAGLTQLKKDVHNDVAQQLAATKAESQVANTVNNSQLPATAASNNGIATSTNGLQSGIANISNVSSDGLVWVDDLQNNDGANLNALSLTDNKRDTNTVSNSDTQKLAALLNPALNQKQNTVSKNNNENLRIDNPLIFQNNKQDTKPAIPYYTIPVNATLTGAILMQPLIGRVPIDGKVPDPYTFKAIIGAKNLAANGVDIPSDIQGIVVSGVAEGDMLGGCARGNVTSMTFIFQDGRISTTQAKDSESLGTIAAPNGNPCIAGSFHSDAAIFLGASAGLAGLQGYGNALSQSQLNTTTSSATGATISALIGSANKYAVGQGFSASAQAAQQ